MVAIEAMISLVLADLSKRKQTHLSITPRRELKGMECKNPFGMP